MEEEEVIPALIHLHSLGDVILLDSIVCVDPVEFGKLASNFNEDNFVAKAPYCRVGIVKEDKIPKILNLGPNSRRYFPIICFNNYPNK